MSAGRPRILIHIDILHDDVVGGIDVIAILGRDVFEVLLDNGEMARRSVKPFAASRKLGDADEHSALIKIRTLLSETDLDRGFPPNPIPIPI